MACASFPLELAERKALLTDHVQNELSSCRLQLAGQEIARGRGALARTRPGREGHALCEDAEIARMLSLLWRPEATVRQEAARALAGGDLHAEYALTYGHFVSALLRAVHEQAASMPSTNRARYDAVALALGSLLDHTGSDILAMRNMAYSFLSSALYLALIATCRDAIEAVYRLRAFPAEGALCRLLGKLSRAANNGRLSRRDHAMLVRCSGKAFSALHPDCMPEFWQHVKHPSLPTRQAVAPAISELQDRRAVPHLLDALTDQPAEIAAVIMTTLGRIGDARALPALVSNTQSRDNQVRKPARAAVAAIERALSSSAKNTLLRAAEEATEPVEELLRATTAERDSEPPDELLRSYR